MSTCTKTGIDVYIEEYNASVRADLHVALGATVINFNPDSWGHWAVNPGDHVLVRVGNGYLHREKGIIVNPSEMRRVKK